MELKYMQKWRDKKPIFIDSIQAYEWYESMLDKYEDMIDNMKRCNNCKNLSSYGGCGLCSYEEKHDNCKNGKYELWEYCRD